MSDELVTVLARFHREVVLPDIERVVADRVAALVNPRFDAIDGHFDAIYQRFIRIEDEYQAIKAALGRLEERLDSLEAQHRDLVATIHRLDERLSRVEKRMDELVDPNWHAVLRSELQHLRKRLDGLQARVDALERHSEP
jgi:chromosome segregation ATPase